MTLELPDLTPAALILAVKDQLRARPDGGLSHGALSQMTDDPRATRLKSAPAPEVLVNYLGQLDNMATATPFTALAPEPTGPDTAPSAPRAHLCEINAATQNGRLTIHITLPEDTPEDRIQTFETALRNNLEALATTAKQQTKKSLSKSDLSSKSVSSDALARLKSKHRA